MPNTYDQPVGNYTLRLTAKDYYGNTYDQEFPFEVIDTRPPMLTVQIKDNDVAVSTITNGKGSTKYYDVIITSDEPLEDIDRFGFSYGNCNGPFIDAFDKPEMVGQDPYTWSSQIFLINGLTCLEGQEGDADLIIEGADHNGQRFDTTDVENPTFSIDTKGPEPPAFYEYRTAYAPGDAQTYYYVSDANLQVYGFTAEQLSSAGSYRVGINYGKVETADEEAFSTVSAQDNPSTFNGEEVTGEVRTDSPEGSTLLNINEQKTAFFNADTFVGITADHKSDFTYYDIESSVFEQEPYWTSITLAEPLQKDVTTGESVYPFAYQYPTGWFDFPYSYAGEGSLYFFGFAYDPFDNPSEDSSVFRVIYDNTPPAISLEPSDGTISADETSTMTAHLSDTNAGLDCSSLEIRINRSEIFDTSTVVQSCGPDSGACQATSCQDGNDEQQIIIDGSMFDNDGEPGMDEGSYLLEVKIKDNAGNEQVSRSAFVLDSGVTHEPEMHIDGGLTYPEDDRMYVSNLRPTIGIAYTHDVPFLVDLFDAFKLPTDQGLELSIARVDDQTFTIDFNRDLEEAYTFHQDDPTRQTLELHSKKQVDGEWSRPGRHFKDFVIDVTPPVITPDPLDAVNSGTFTLTGSFTDWNIDHIEVYGDDLYMPAEGYTVALDDQVDDHGRFSVDVELYSPTNEQKTVHLKGYDKAGNVGEEASLTFMLDTMEPYVSCDGSTDPVWTNQDQTITITATDSGSGIKAIYYCEAAGCEPYPNGNIHNESDTLVLEYTGHRGELPISFMALDKADNPSGTGMCMVRIDQEVPKTSATTTQADGTTYTEDTWTNQEVMVELASADCEEDSGCAGTFYCDGEGCTPDLLYTGPVVLDEGTHHFRYSSHDQAGNIEEPQELTILIDQSRPSLGQITLSNDNLQYYGPENTLYTNIPALTISGSMDDDGMIIIDTTDAVGSPHTIEVTKDAPFSVDLDFADQGIDWREHNITITGMDKAGNPVSADYQNVVVYSTVAPLITMIDPREVCESGGSDCGYYTNAQDLVLSLETHEIPGGAGSDCEIDPRSNLVNQVQPMATDDHETHTYDGYGTVADNQEFTFIINCKDRLLGNQGQLTGTFLVDQMKPELSLTLDNGKLANAENNLWNLLHRIDSLKQTDIVAKDTSFDSGELDTGKLRCEHSCLPDETHCGDAGYTVPFADGDSYQNEQKETIIFDEDSTDQEYAYAVTCYDKAGNHDTKEIRVLDLVATGEMLVLGTSPADKGFTNENSLVLSANTSQYALCRISFDHGSLQDMDGTTMEHRYPTSADEGAHQAVFDCVSTDSFNAAQKTIDFTVDTIPPSIPVIISTTHPEDTKSSSTSPAFGFTAADETSGIRGYSFDFDRSPNTQPDEVVEPGTSVSYQDVEDGDWYFHVRAIDQAGNAGDTATYHIIIDTTAPEPPVIMVQPKLTNDGNIEILGTTASSDGPVTVQVYIRDEQDNLLDTLTTDSDGSFILDTQLMGDTEHYFITAKADDNLGNALSMASNIEEAWYITQAPKFLSITPSDQTRTCKVDKVVALLERYGTAEISQDSTVTVIDSSGGEMVTDKGVDFRSLEGGEYGQLTFTPAAGTFPDGSYDVSILALDELGNSKTYQSYFEVNEFAPCTGWNITDVMPLNRIHLQDIPSPTNQDTITIAGTLTYEDNSPAENATVIMAVKYDDQAYEEIARQRTDSQGRFSQDYRFSEGEGPYYIYVEAHDVTGSDSDSLTKQVNYVTSAPLFETILPAEGDTLRSVDEITYQILQNDDATLVFHDATDIDLYRQDNSIVQTGKSAMECGVPGCLMGKLTINSPLEDGTYHVRATTADILGNRETYDSPFTIDTDAPEIAFVRPTSQEFADDEVYVVDSSFEIFGKVSSPYPPFSGTVRQNNDPAITLNIYEADGEWLFTNFFTLRDGDNDFVYTITDALGNTATTTVTAHKRPSGYAPSITITSPEEGSTYFQDQVLRGTYTYQEEDLLQLSLYRNGIYEKDIEGFGDGSFSEPISLEEGSNDIRVVATDRWGGTEEDNVVIDYGSGAFPYTIILDPLVSPTNSKNLNVTGTVLSLSNEPAAGITVEVSVDGSTRRTLSDGQGRFSVDTFTLSKSNYEYSITAAAIVGDSIEYYSDLAMESVWHIDTIPPTAMSPDETQSYYEVDHISLMTEEVDGTTSSISNPELVKGGTIYALVETAQGSCGDHCRIFNWDITGGLTEDGRYTFRFDISDGLNSESQTHEFTIDRNALQITFTDPAELEVPPGSTEGIYVTDQHMTLYGKVDGTNVDTPDDISSHDFTRIFTCQDGGVCFTKDVDLIPGTNDITLTATANDGRSGSKTATINLQGTSYNPKITILNPADGSRSFISKIVVSGTYSIDDSLLTDLTLQVDDGNPVSIEHANGAFSHLVSFTDEKPYLITVSMTDKWGTTYQDSVVVTYGGSSADVPLQVTLDPIDSPTNMLPLILTGQVMDTDTDSPAADTLVVLDYDNREDRTTTDQDGRFSFDIPDPEENHHFTFLSYALEGDGFPGGPDTLELWHITRIEDASVYPAVPSDTIYNAVQDIIIQVPQIDGAMVGLADESITLRKDNSALFFTLGSVSRSTDGETATFTVPILDELPTDDYLIDYTLIDSLQNSRTESRPFRIDTQAPVIDVDTPEEFTDPQSKESIDGLYTTENQVTITGTVSGLGIDSPADVTDHNLDHVTDCSGKVCYAKEEQLVPGRNEVTLQVTDSQGRTGKRTLIFLKRPDQYDASITITEPAATQTYYSHTPVRGTYSIPTDDLAGITADLDGTPQDVQYANGHFSFTTDLVEGTNHITVTMTDKWGTTYQDSHEIEYGTATTEVPYDVMLDPLTSPTDHNSVTISGTVRNTDSGTPAEGIAVNIHIDDDLIQTTSGTAGTFSTTYDFPRTDEEYLISAQAVVGDGFTGEPDTTHVWFIRTLPETAIHPNPTDSYNLVDRIIIHADQKDDATLSITGMSLLNQQTLQPYGFLGTAESDCGGQCKSFSTPIDINDPNTMPEGTYELTYIIQDTLQSEQRTSTFTIDRSAPDIDIAQPSVFSDPESKESIDGWYTSIQDLTITGTLSGLGIGDAADVIADNLDSVTDCTQGVCFSKAVTLSSGTQTITLSVTDAQGRTGTRTLTFHLQPTNYNPSIIIQGPESGGTLTKNNLIYGTYTIDDASIDSMAVSVDGTGQEDVEHSNGDFTARITISDTGTSTVTISMTDKWGTTYQDSISLTYGGTDVPYSITLASDTPSPTNAESVLLSGTVADTTTSGPAADIPVQIRYEGQITTTTTATDGTYEKRIALNKDNHQYLFDAVALAGDGFPSEPSNTVKLWHVNRLGDLIIYPDSTTPYNDVSVIKMIGQQIDDATLSIRNPQLLREPSTDIPLGPTTQATCGGQCREFSIPINTPLEEGSYTLTYTVSDTLQDEQRQATFTVDKSTPIITITTPPALTDPGSTTSLTGIYTTEDTMYLEGTIDGLGITDATDIAAHNFDQVFDCGNDICFNTLVALRPGTQEITLTATDPQDRTGLRSFTVHKQPTGFDPEVTIDIPSSSSTFTSNTPVRGSYTLPEDEVETVRLLLNGNEVARPGHSNQEFSGTVTLDSGSNTIRAEVTDKWGDTHIATRTITYGTSQIPYSIILDGLTSPTLLGTITISGTVTDINTGGTAADVLVSIEDDYDRQQTTTGSDGRFSSRFSLPYPDEPYLFSATALIGDGFPGEPATAMLWYINAIPPAVIHPNDQDTYNSADTIILEVQQLDDATISIQSPRLTLDNVLQDIGTITQTSCGPDCRHFEIPVQQALEDGRYDLTYRIDDTLQEETRHHQFTIDHTAPTIGITTPAELADPKSTESINGIYTDQTTMLLNGRLSGIGIDGVEDVKPGHNLGSLFPCSDDPQQVCYNRMVVLDQGTTEVELQATDKDGRQGHRTIIFHRKPSSYAPGVSIATPKGSTFTKTNPLEGTYTVPEDTLVSLSLYLNGAHVKDLEPNQGQFRDSVVLDPDAHPNIITVTATDKWGTTYEDSVSVSYGGGEFPYFLRLDNGLTSPTDQRDITISGTVFDRATGQPAPLVDLLFDADGTEETGTSSPNGRFNFDYSYGAANKKYTFAVSAVVGDGFTSEPAITEAWYVTSIPSMNIYPNSKDSHNTVEQLVLLGTQVDDATLTLDDIQLTRQNNADNDLIRLDKDSLQRFGCSDEDPQCVGFSVDIAPEEQPLPEGQYRITYQLSDTLQSEQRTSTFTIDRTAPRIRFTFPDALSDPASSESINGIYTDQDNIELRGYLLMEGNSQWQDSNIQTIYDCPSGSCFTHQVSLVPGTQTITLSVTDDLDRTGTRTVIVHRKPTGGNSVSITSPSDGITVYFKDVSIEGVFDDPYINHVEVSVNGEVQQDLQNLYGNTFSADVTLTNGSNEIVVREYDQWDEFSQDQITLFYDQSGLSSSLSCPGGNGICFTRAEQITINGNIPSALPVEASLFVENRQGTLEYPLTLAGNDNSFTQSLDLAEGENTLYILATDATTTSQSNELLIIKDTQAPSISLEMIAAGDTIKDQGVTSETPVEVKVAYREDYPGRIHATLNGHILFDDYPASSPLLIEDVPLDSAGDGRKVLVVTMDDLAGNRNTSSSVVYLDTRTPETTITAVTSHDGPVVFRGGIYKTAQDKATIHGSYREEHLEGIFLDDGRTEADINREDSTFTLDVPLRGKAGEEEANNITILTLDQAGHVAETRTRIVRDQAAPAVQITSLPFDGSSYYTQEETPELHVVTDEPATCSITYLPANFTNPYTQAMADSANGIDHDATIEIPLPKETGSDRTSTITIRCVDELGNDQPETEARIVLDDTLPTIGSYGLSQSILLTDEGTRKSYLLVKTPYTEILVDDASEPVRCRYGTTPSFESMTAFPDEAAFKMMKHASDTLQLEDGNEYDYYVQCEDRALRKTGMKQLHIKVNLSKDVWIIDEGPKDYAIGPDVDVWVKTFRNATCSLDTAYEDGNAITDWVKDVFDPATEMSSYLYGPTAGEDCGTISGSGTDTESEQAWGCMGEAMLDNCRPASVSMEFPLQGENGQTINLDYSYRIYGMQEGKCVISLQLVSGDMPEGDLTPAYQEGAWFQCPVDTAAYEQESRNNGQNPEDDLAKFAQNVYFIWAFTHTDPDAGCFGTMGTPDGNLPQDPPGIQGIGQGLVFYHSKTLTGLDDYTTYAFDVTCTDPQNVFDDAAGRISFLVIPELDISLIAPKHGYSTSSIYDAVIGTTRDAECRWDISGVALPFDLKRPFNQTGGRTHTLSQIDWFTPNNQKMHVMCKDTYGYTKEASFGLHHEPFPPTITTAKAEPEEILQTVNNNLQTTLVVETYGKPSLCRYSTTTMNYSQMEHVFEPFDTDNADSYQTTHRALITGLADNGHYEYNVACEGLSGLVSKTMKIRFLTDLERSLQIRFNRPADGESYNRTTQDLNITTNKETLCYYRTEPDGYQMGMENSAQTQHFTRNAVHVSKEGTSTVYVTCYFGEEQADASSSFIVDLSPPERPVITQDNVTRYTDRLTASWTAQDNLSGIGYYEIAIGSASATQDILDWTDVGRDTSRTVHGLNLSDGARYYWFARATDRVGWHGPSAVSTGIRIDTTLPVENNTPSCHDGIRNQGEADIDCGGYLCSSCDINSSCNDDNDCLSGNCKDKSCQEAICKNGRSDAESQESDIDCGGDCDDCSNGKACFHDTDCESRYCDGGTCKESSCSDGLHNGFETDTDCGGGCDLCDIGFGCGGPGDCSSGVCSDGVCKASSCDDGLKNGDETDVDCGGSCDGCSNGDACELNIDCTSGICENSICKTGNGPNETTDTDGDGMPDDWETFYDLNPNDPTDANGDLDKDGLSNLGEYEEHTDPLMTDTDGDTYDDNYELLEGYDPTDPNSKPPGSNLLYIILLILLILALLGGGGYIGYKELYEKKKRPPLKPLVASRRTTAPIRKKAPPRHGPAPSQTRITQAFGMARARRPTARSVLPARKPVLKQPARPKEEWIEVGQLKKKMPEGDKDVLDKLSGLIKTNDVFDELESVTRGLKEGKFPTRAKPAKSKTDTPVQKRPRAKKAQETRPAKDVFRSLQNLAPEETEEKAFKDLEKIAEEETRAREQKKKETKKPGQPRRQTKQMPVPKRKIPQRTKKTRQKKTPRRPKAPGAKKTSRKPRKKHAKKS